MARLISPFRAASGFGITILARQSAATAGVTGQVTFFDDQSGPAGHTNTLTIIAHGLDAPPAGFQYDAWFINDQSEGVLPLGTLTPHHQTFSPTYSGNTINAQDAPNLLTPTI